MGKMMGIKELIENVEGYLDSFCSPEDKDKVNRILNAINTIDRKYFVDPEYAYLDTALPIGYNQTISQPSTVARMLMLAEINKGDDVLELGTGSGWNASLIAYISYPGKTLSLDIIDEIIQKAKSNITGLKKELSEKDNRRLSNLELKFSNIFKNIDSWPERYNKIVITAGIRPHQEDKIEKLALGLLEEEGRIICPHTQGPLMTLKKSKSTISKTYTAESYVFVPLFS